MGVEKINVGPYRTAGEGQGPEKKLVFCKDCRYLHLIGSHRCHAPENMMPTWYFMEPRESPQQLNANNDCQWFAPKEDGGW